MTKLQAGSAKYAEAGKFGWLEAWAREPGTVWSFNRPRLSGPTLYVSSVRHQAQEPTRSGKFQTKARKSIFTELPGTTSLLNCFLAFIPTAKLKAIKFTVN